MNTRREGRSWLKRWLRHAALAGLLAGCLLVLFTPVAHAHATLLRSTPQKDEVLPVAPRQVRLWFTEDLTPSLSTVAILTTGNRRVDLRDAGVSSSDPREMDVSLADSLQPGVYLVLYRTHSTADGHFYRGSFLFRIAQLDGTVPPDEGITVPPDDPLGGVSQAVVGGFDGPTLFTWGMTSLVELGTVFWIGAYLFLQFVVKPRRGRREQPSSELALHVLRQFEHRWSVPRANASKDV